MIETCEIHESAACDTAVRAAFSDERPIHVDPSEAQIGPSVLQRHARDGPAAARSVSTGGQAGVAKRAGRASDA